MPRFYSQAHEHDDGEHCPHLCEHCDQQIDDIDNHETCPIHNHCYDGNEHDECPMCVAARENPTPTEGGESNSESTEQAEA